MRVVVALAIALLLSGATCQQRADAPVGDADPQCYMPCIPSLTDTGVRWTADAEDPAAFDELGESVVPELAGKAMQCERRRQACTDFLNVLKQRGVIRAGE